MSLRKEKTDGDIQATIDKIILEIRNLHKSVETMGKAPAVLKKLAMILAVADTDTPALARPHPNGFLSRSNMDAIRSASTNGMQPAEDTSHAHRFSHK